MPDRESESIREAAQRLARVGVAIVLLREQDKRPALDRWTSLPRMSETDLVRRYAPGQNIGVRLGAPSETRTRRFVHGIDMDIRIADRAEEAWAAVLKVFPGAREWPRVKSGSGGASRHLYFMTDAPFRKCNIARSEYLTEVATSDGAKDKPEWEVDFYGTGSLLVLPPSIHPNGKPYRWEDGAAPDFTDLPFVRQTAIAPLFERDRKRRDRSLIPPEPLDSLQEILDTKTWDNDEGQAYDKWRDVLFAVKQEYDGTDDYDSAFQIVEEWSARSPKHSQRRFEEVWEHARTDRPDAITLGTLKKAAAKEIDDERKNRIAMDDERPRDKEGRIIPPNWLSATIRDGLGEAVNCAENRRLFLLNQHPMEFLHWSEEDQRPVWRRPPPGAAPDLRDLVFPETANSIPYDTKAHYQILQMVLRKPPFRMEIVKKEELNDSVWLAAQQRPWQRIRELLTREEWDGVPRVDTLLQDYLGVEDSPYARFASRLLVLGPMCRVLWRGVKVDYAPILQGPQGSGKDRFLELLCTFGSECLYTASTFDMTKPAEYVQAIRGKLIVHMAEMATFKKTSIEQIKTFLTEHEDTARLSYEPLARTYRRICVCVFSTNDKGGYLADGTGNRRFLPIVLGDPETGPDNRPTAYAKTFVDLEKVVGQIWAEAHEMAMQEAERQGGRVREILIQGDAMDTARRSQMEKMAETPEMDIAARALRLLDQPAPLDELIDHDSRTDATARQMAVRNQITPREVWVDILGEKADQWHRNSHVTVRALEALPGWEKVPGRHRHRGELRPIYRRVGTDGKPSIIDDLAPEDGKVIRMADERRRRT